VPDILWVFSRLDLLQAIDILIVATIFYLIFLSIQGTRAVQLLWGTVLVISLAVAASAVFQLTTLGWLIRNSIPALLVAIPVIFQPELRRILERLGRAGGWVNWPPRMASESAFGVVDEVARACTRLAERRHGALIVIERQTGLQDFIDTGVALDAIVSAETLATIFYPNTPLHDGAVIIRQNRIAAAGCILPLSENLTDVPTLGTRHRAAVGITEGADAIAVVVSEQTGIISIAMNGRLDRNLDEVRLKDVLLTSLEPRRRPLALRGKVGVDMPRASNALAVTKKR